MPVGNSMVVKRESMCGVASAEFHEGLRITNCLLNTNLLW